MKTSAAVNSAARTGKATGMLNTATLLETSSSSIKRQLNSSIAPSLMFPFDLEPWADPLLLTVVENVVVGGIVDIVVASGATVTTGTVKGHGGAGAIVAIGTAANDGVGATVARGSATAVRGATVVTLAVASLVVVATGDAEGAEAITDVPTAVMFGARVVEITFVVWFELPVAFKQQQVNPMEWSFQATPSDPLGDPGQLHFFVQSHG